MKIELSKIEIEYIIKALKTADYYETTFIDCFINVHDGTEKEPIKYSKNLINHWRKIIIKLTRRNP